MADETAYLERDDIRLYAYQVQDSDLTLFDTLITRASRIFDILCCAPAGYFLQRSAAAETRTVYGSGLSFLALPRHYEPVTAVTVPGDYTAPYWSEVDGCLRTKDSKGTVFQIYDPNRGIWPAGVAVSVTAKWGFAAVPEDVKEAVAELTIAMWRSKDHAFLKAVNLENQALIVHSTPERVKLVAEFYKAQRQRLVPAFV